MIKRSIAGAVAAGVLLVLAALPAAAQGYTLDENLTRSGDTCVPGEDVTLTVNGAAPGTDVTFIFDGPPEVVLGIVTADANGIAVLDAVWPNTATPGFHDVIARGTDAGPEPDALGPLELVSSVECVFAGDDPGDPSGTLPRTGADSLPWVRIGLVLVALGGIVLLTSRKRYSAVSETV